MPYTYAKGMSLIEMLSILIILGVLSVVSIRAVMTTQNIRIDEARLSVLSALALAQSRALTSMAKVRITAAANTISIHVDQNDDGNFASSEALSKAGQSFPLSLPGGVAISDASMTFEANGRTAATQLTLTQGAQSRLVSVSSTGYAN